MPTVPAPTSATLVALPATTCQSTSSATPPASLEVVASPAAESPGSSPAEVQELSCFAWSRRKLFSGQMEIRGSDGNQFNPADLMKQMNSDAFTNFSNHPPNGKKCFACDGNDCTKTINCQGNEDRCISLSANLDKTKVKGCVSKSMCSTTVLTEAAGLTGVEISCCQGDLCNSASSTSAGLLLLVPLLIPLVLFS
ncbi:uncharacterized protein KZ484_013247 [Pholidichthys leucotaenia]